MAILSKQALKVENNTSFPNNSIGAITATGLRDYNTNIIDSMVDENTFTPFSASVLVSINSLNAFTASQQPSFTALNAFTASQTSTNNTVNGRLNSNTASIAALDSEVNQLQSWSGSINEIIDKGNNIGYSTRLYFGGDYVTSSIVANVNGPIAVITINHDDTKLNTSSFNAYTASTATTQSIFSASVATQFSASTSTFNQFSASQSNFNIAATGSIVQLLNFSASLDATYATDAQLNFSSSVLQAGIDTKLNTSSFNAYTQSYSSSVATSFSASTSTFNEFTSSQLSINTGYNQYTASTNARINSLEDRSGSYAITGSNNFTGSQTITGSVYGNVVSLAISSNTASMDLSKGNFFTLTLVSGSVTRLEATNINKGQTINLLITQSTPASGSLVYGSQFKYNSANQYTASTTAGANDILTFLTFDNTTVFAAAIKSLQ